MAKTYNYYGVCFNDFEVGENGGLRLRPQCFERDPHASSDDPDALWAEAVKAREKFGDPVTGCGVTYNDPVNDCTYVLWGNHFYEDIGVFKPCLPEKNDRAEHTKHAVIPKDVSCMD